MIPGPLRLLFSLPGTPNPLLHIAASLSFGSQPKCHLRQILCDHPWQMLGPLPPPCQLLLQHSVFHVTYYYLKVPFFISFLFVFGFVFGPAMQHVGSQFLNQGSNPFPLQWKHGVLTTEPPGSPESTLF